MAFLSSPVPSLNLYDNSKREEVAGNYFTNENLEAYSHIVANINELFQSGKISFISLSPFRDQSKKDKIIECNHLYKDITTGKGINKWVFTTTSYIGFFIKDGFELNIRPRFGAKVLQHMLSSALHIYISDADARLAYKSTDNFWLLLLLWKTLLQHALYQNRIPRTYVLKRQNLRYFKGRLDVKNHIHANLFNPARFFCQYRELTPDTVINRTIIFVFDLLKEHDHTNLLGEFGGYIEILLYFGVQEVEVTPEDIENIKYTRMDEVYKPLMDLSKTIIQLLTVAPGDEKNFPGISFFLDLSELWELYLLGILSRSLPSQYRIYSPNLSTEKEYLLIGDKKNSPGIRHIRPDIIIEKGEEPVMIIDAKYKRYNHFGDKAKNGDITDYGAISSDDLYQMTTYLFHYGHPSTGITGLFVSPVLASDDSKPYNLYEYIDHNKYKIGLLNMGISKFDNRNEATHENLEPVDDDEILKELKSQEEIFARTVVNILNLQ